MEMFTHDQNIHILLQKSVIYITVDQANFCYILNLNLAMSDICRKKVTEQPSGPKKLYSIFDIKNQK